MNDSTKQDRRVAVVGAGPAGLMAAEVLSAAGGRVTVYDRMAGPGRKFLMAGRGGLNLTHGEPLDRFIARYGPAADRLRPAIEAFPPSALRDWSAGLGQDTFVGSSGRVFPAAFKASPLLRAWLARLDRAGVRFAFQHRWIGWDPERRLSFEGPRGESVGAASDAVVLALGGASWPRLGSDGGWVGLLRARGVTVCDLRPGNCGFRVDWSEHLRARFAGTPLKRLAVTFGGMTVRGEAMVTATGIEGGAIYALSGPIRDALAESSPRIVTLDLCPDFTPAELIGRLSAPRKRQSLSTFLRKSASLAPVAIALLRETADGPLPTSAEDLAARLKAVPLRIVAPAAIDRAISSAGGIDWDELDAGFMLRRLPGVFAAGEMLDWEAPTGGYLLQACFATGAAAGRGILEWWDATP